MGRRSEHWGIVIDNRDPQQLGRLIVQCDTIAENDVLEWIKPNFHYVDSDSDVSAGSFWIPNPGAVVVVEIEDNDDSESLELDPRWKCCIYSDGQVPEEFIKNYPNRRGWKTRAGHLLYFDDTEDEQTFNIIHPSGASVLIDNDGTIYVKQASGQTIELGANTPRESVIHGESRNTDWNTFLTAFTTFLTDLGVVPGQADNCSTMSTAASTLQGQLSGHLSDVVKAE